jgi:hypothetical protein
VWVRTLKRGQKEKETKKGRGRRYGIREDRRNRKI